MHWKILPWQEKEEYHKNDRKISPCMNCFCGMTDRRKAFSLISSRGQCQRSSPLRISDALRAGFELAQNLSSGFVEWSCAAGITTGNIEVEKHTFQKSKSLFSIYDINVDRIVASNRVPFGKKCFEYFIGYKDGKKFRPLCVMLPKMSACRRDFDETDYMFFFWWKIMNC